MDTPYTSARFRTDRDALGVSADFIAQRLGLATVTVWKYQSPNRTEPLPERVAELMDTLARTQGGVMRALATLPHLVRPRDERQADTMIPELAGWGVHAVGLAIAAAVDIRRARGESTTIEWASA